VTATFDSVTSNATTVTVEPGDVDRVEIEPEGDQIIEAGEDIEFNATAFDEDNNVVEDDDSEFGWEAESGEISDEGLFEETEAGDYNVTATLEGVTSNATMVTVEPGDVETVELDPEEDQTIESGETVGFNATASDAFENVVEDNDSEFDWDAEDGSISGDGLFDETDAGDYNVTAELDGVTSNATMVTVEPGDVETVEIDPEDNQTIDSGDTVDFDATAFDENNNVVEDDDSEFTWDADNGSISAEGVFDETEAGDYDVTAELDGVTSDATTVTVESDGDVEFRDQAIGESSPDAVLAENVDPVDEDDFLVLTEGEEVEDGDDVIDAVQLDELTPGDNVTLDAEGAEPGTHTVAMHAPDEAGDGPDPDAPRGVDATAMVFDADVDIDDQAFEDSTEEVEVGMSDLQPEEDSDYVIVLTDEDDEVLGDSGDLSGKQDDVTITVDEITATTDVTATLHFPNGDFGDEIPAADGDEFGTVSDAAEIEIQEAEGGNVDFQDQALGEDDAGTSAVLAENVEPVEVATVDNAFDPQDDFLVLTEGTEVEDGDDIIDFVQFSEFGDGDDVVLEADGADPGTHTVAIHEPGDVSTVPDPDAPRGVDATATVFGAEIEIDDQSFEESTHEVDVDLSDLQPEGDSDYVIVLTDEDDEVLGDSGDLSGEEEDVTITVDEITATTDVTATLHFPNGDYGDEIPILDEDEFGTVSDTAEIEIQEPAFFEVSNLEAPDQVSEEESITVNATVENTGDVEGTQDILFKLDEDGDFDDPEVEETVEEDLTLSSGEDKEVNITLDAPADAGTYEHGIFSEDDNETAALAVGPNPQRSINVSEAEPGDTVEVTVTAQVDEPADVSLLEEWSPDADGNPDIVSETFDDTGGVVGPGDIIRPYEPGQQGLFETVYELEVPDDSALVGEVYQWEEWDGEDGSALRIDGIDFDIEGDQEFTVVENSGDSTSATNTPIALPQ